MFMDNFYWPPWHDLVTNLFNDKMSYRFIAVADIGRVAAEAFAQPERFNGQTIELAGDSLTRAQVEKVWKEVTGNELGGGPMPGVPKPLADTTTVSCLFGPAN